MSKIEWCDITVNPVVGCSKCGPGCEHCYAERFAAKLARNPFTASKYRGVVDQKGRWTGLTNYDPSWYRKLPGKPKRIFLGSMTDLFHPSISEDIVGEIFGRIREAGEKSGHTFMLLTKRIRRAEEIIDRLPLPGNVWLGATVCNQKEADAAIPVLGRIPAAKRFLSVEPMLGPVDLDAFTGASIKGTRYGSGYSVSVCGAQGHAEANQAIGNGIDWVICGGETGPGARPIHPDWVRNLRDQCGKAGIPFFFKNWGEWLPCTQIPDDFDNEHLPEPGDIGDDGIFTPPPALVVRMRNGSQEQTFRIRHKELSRLLDGADYSQFPKG